MPPNCDHSRRPFLFTSWSDAHKKYLRYFQGGKTALLPDRRQLISQRPRVPEQEESSGSRGVGQIRSRRQGAAIYNQPVSGAYWSSSTNDALYTKLTNWEKRVMYEPQSAKVPGVFQSLSDFVAAAQEITKPPPSTRSVEELDKKGQLLKSRPIRKRRFLRLWRRMKRSLRKDHFGSAVVIALSSPFRARRTRYRWQSRKHASNSVGWRALKKPSLLTAPQKEGFMLKKTDVTA